MADQRGLLIVGAGLGTTASTLWGPVAELLKDRFEVIGVDLPGHGIRAPASQPFGVEDLAANVRKVAEERAQRQVWYAGVSLAGGVAFALANNPGPIQGVAAIAAASTFGAPEAWLERAQLVRKAGTSVLVAGSSQRWFAPGFIEREGELVGQMLHDLSDTDDESYALCCEALAAYDVRDTLSEIGIPFLLAPGSADVVITPERASEDAARIPGATVTVFDGCGHQPPVESPQAVADALTAFISTHGENS